MESTSQEQESGKPLAPRLDFEQQPGEGDKPFSAFSAYLALGPTRSLARAAQVTGRTRDQLAHWSSRWRWRARTAAYHAHLTQLERQSTEDLVRQKSRDWAAMHESVRRQAWEQAEDLVALAEHFKARWRDSDRLPAFDTIVRALELAFKLRQFATGMPSEIKTLNATLAAPDGGPVQVALQAALHKIYGQPLPGEVIDIPASVGTTPTLSPSDPALIPTDAMKEEL